MNCSFCKRYGIDKFLEQSFTNSGFEIVDVSFVQCIERRLLKFINYQQEFDSKNTYLRLSRMNTRSFYFPIVIYDGDKLV